MLVLMNMIKERKLKKFKSQTSRNDLKEKDLTASKQLADTITDNN